MQLSLVTSSHSGTFFLFSRLQTLMLHSAQATVLHLSSAASRQTSLFFLSHFLSAFTSQQLEESLDSYSTTSQKEISVQRSSMVASFKEAKSTTKRREKTLKTLMISMCWTFQSQLKLGP